MNPFGERADGRDAVTRMYASYFDGMLGGTTTTFEVQGVRDIDASHCFVDALQQILAPDGSVVLAVHLATLMRRDGDDWRFVDARPYAYARQ